MWTVCVSTTEEHLEKLQFPLMVNSKKNGEKLCTAFTVSGSKNGKQVKEYMDKRKLVPDEIVMTMVKDRLNGPNSHEKGWLLDGYPRSSSQAVAPKEFGFQRDLIVLLEVPTLRIGLNNLYPDSNVFKEVQMNDASEVLGVILGVI